MAPSYQPKYAIIMKNWLANLKVSRGSEIAIGIVIIDVCEGSALEALPHMENIVLAQPKGFTSLQSAISYVYKSHQVRNLESAQVSVAGMVK